MARRFAKVSEKEIKTAFFYPSDLVNTKTTIPFRVGEERWIYTLTLRVSVYIHHYSPPLPPSILVVLGYLICLLWIRSHWNTLNTYREQPETSACNAIKSHLNG